MPIREVQGVPIVAWQQPDAIHTAPAELRGFFGERDGVERLLLDLSACQDLNASSMEALTEAFRVCADRKARVGMFGLNFSTLQLIEILGLHTNLPPHMGETEAEALAAITSNGAAPPPPQQGLSFEVPASGGGVELEFDLESEPATKKPVDIEFDLDVGTAPTARFDPAAVAEATGTSVDVGLTTVLWNDLASQGYVIGGEGAEEIMAAAASTQVAPSPAAAPPASGGDTGIDFGDLEPAGGVSTEDTGDEGASWTAAPAAPAGGIDFGAGASGGIDFGAPPADPGAFGAPAGAGAFGSPTPGGAFGGAAMVSSGLFGGPPAGDFSPVDSGASAPPAAVSPGPVAQAPVGGAPVPGGMGGMAPDDDTPDDSNETIMFAPGALDQALAAAAAAAAAENNAAPDPTPAAPPEPAAPVAEPAPVAAAPAPAPVAEDSGFYSSDNETVMIQPGMLDMALLAEVAKAAGEETVIAPPPVEEPQAAPPPKTNTVPTGDELAVRLFVLDQGIKSDLHIEVLGRLLKFEKVIGPDDLKIEGDVRGVLDQFAQNRLLRRQRSARVRGGNGFVLSASPAARGTVTRLWRMWSDPQGRSKLSAWIREG